MEGDDSSVSTISGQLPSNYIEINGTINSSVAAGSSGAMYSYAISGDTYSVAIVSATDETRILSSGFSLEGTNFKVILPLDSNTIDNIAGIVIKKDGKSLYRSMLGRVPKLSDISGGGNFSIKGVKVNENTTAKSLLILMDPAKLPMNLISTGEIDIEKRDVKKLDFEVEIERRITDCEQKTKSVVEMIDLMNKLSANEYVSEEFKKTLDISSLKELLKSYSRYINSTEDEVPAAGGFDKSSQLAMKSGLTLGNEGDVDKLVDALKNEITTKKLMEIVLSKTSDGVSPGGEYDLSQITAMAKYSDGAIEKVPLEWSIASGSGSLNASKYTASENSGKAVLNATYNDGVSVIAAEFALKITAASVTSVDEIKNEMEKQSEKNWTPKETTLSKDIERGVVDMRTLAGSESSAQMVPSYMIMRAPEHAISSLPSKFDWRNKNGINWVSSVKDQGSYPTCVAHGCLAALEAQLRISTNNPYLNVDFSEFAYFYQGKKSANDIINYYQAKNPNFFTQADLNFRKSYNYDVFNNGWDTFFALSYLKIISGAVNEEYCPYYLIPNYKFTATPTFYQIKEFNFFRGKDFIKSALMNGPVIARMEVYKDFFRYSGGIYKRVSNDGGGGHVVLIVGYDDFNQCWNVKNSWGTGWGENGYFNIKYGECNIDSEASNGECYSIKIADNVGNQVVPVPQNLKTSSVSESEMSFSWNKVADPASYIITLNGKEIARTISNNYKISNLLPEMKYDIGVMANRGIINSIPATLSVTTPKSAEWKTADVNWNVEYFDKWDKYGLIKIPGATKIKVHFKKIDVENGYDRLFIGNEIITGAFADKYCETINGDSIFMRLISDDANHGNFAVDKIFYQSLGADTIVPIKSGELFEYQNIAIPVISNVKISGNSSDITITYDLADDSNLCNVSFYVSVNGFPAYKSKNAIGNIGQAAPGLSKTIIWSSALDVVNQSSPVQITIRADKTDTTYASYVSPTFTVSNNYSLQSIALNRPNLTNATYVDYDSVEANKIYNLSNVTATAYYSNGTNRLIEPDKITWKVATSKSGASLTPGDPRLLSVKDAETVTLTGSYTENNIAKTANFKVIATSVQPPSIAFAQTSLEGSAIELKFDKIMKDPSAQVSNFTVKNSSGAAKKVSQAALDSLNNNVVILKMTDFVKKGEAVTVSFNGQLKSINEGMLTAFSNISVANKVSSPNVISAAEVRENGATIQFSLKFGEVFKTLPSSPAGFVIELEGSNFKYEILGINQDPNSADTLLLSLMPGQYIFGNSQPVTLSFKKELANSADQNIISPFDKFKAVNKIVKTTRPSVYFTNGKVDPAGTSIVMSLDYELNSYPSDIKAFRIIAMGDASSGTREIPVLSSKLNDSKRNEIIITLGEPVYVAQNVIMYYTAAEEIKSIHGGKLMGSYGWRFGIDNNLSAITPPLKIVSASAGENGYMVSLAFNRKLGVISAGTENVFKITTGDNNIPVQVRSVKVNSNDDKIIDLNLSSAIYSDSKNITLSYNQIGNLAVKSYENSFLENNIKLTVQNNSKFTRTLSEIKISAISDTAEVNTSFNVMSQVKIIAYYLDSTSAELKSVIWKDADTGVLSKDGLFNAPANAGNMNLIAIYTEKEVTKTANFTLKIVNTGKTIAIRGTDTKINPGINSVYFYTQFTNRGTIHYVIVPEDAVAPNADQIRRGTDGSGQKAVFYETANSVMIYTNGFKSKIYYEKTVSGLKESTGYMMYMVALKDNFTSYVYNVSFKTRSSIELNLNYPLNESLGTDSVKLKIKTNGNGRYYFVVLPEDQTSPVALQIHSGSGPDNKPALSSGNGAISSDVEKTIDIKGLKDFTAYNMFMAFENSGGQLSSDVIKYRFKTRFWYYIKVNNVANGETYGRDIFIDWDAGKA
ncbi:MAG TPA: C1 family peptidase, partial [Candidatus Wallbacteria bacterium]|nr:C1 family peptidase [Candidatus Wallbacteria bacterium]